MLKTLANKYRAHRAYRNTVGELSGLTDRELSDLGICRGDIMRVARHGRNGG